jgi:hypothetical protein
MIRVDLAEGMRIPAPRESVIRSSCDLAWRVQLVRVDVVNVEGAPVEEKLRHRYVTHANSLTGRYRATDPPPLTRV